MKKIICLMLMIAILLTALPAMAENVKRSGDFQYTIKPNGDATIVGYTGNSDTTNIVIPTMVDGYTVTTIGENAFVFIAFKDFSVTLPETITVIESMAFANAKLSSINIPDSVEYIGSGAFWKSNSIQFRISKNHPYFAIIDGSLYNKKDKELLKWVGNSGAVPEGILSIGDYAYADMYIGGSNSDYLPQSIKRIGDYAFRRTNYENYHDIYNTLVIPSAVSEIGSYAFADTHFDIDLSLCTQLESISEGAFGCNVSDHHHIDGVSYNHTATITGPISSNQIKKIGEYAFYGTYIKEWDNKLIMNLEKIEPYTFSGTHFNSADVNIPGTCKVVGEGAFYHFRGDITLTISHGVERIEAKAFDNGWITENVYLPDSLTYIAPDAFNKSTTLVVEKGSYAERWANENAYSYTINGEEQNLDWLTN